MIRRASGSLRLTPASLRLTDMEGNELLTRSFRPENHSMFVPRCRPGTDSGSWEGTGRASTATPLNAQSPDSSTNIVNLLDDEGHGQTRLKGP